MPFLRLLLASSFLAAGLLALPAFALAANVNVSGIADVPAGRRGGVRGASVPGFDGQEKDLSLAADPDVRLVYHEGPASR